MKRKTQALPAPGLPSVDAIRELLRAAGTPDDLIAEVSRPRYISPEAQHLKALIANAGTKRCPHCKRVKPIKTGFGTHAVGKHKVMRPHSWCYDCRSSKESHPTRWGLNDGPVKRRG